MSEVQCPATPTPANLANWLAAKLDEKLATFATDQERYRHLILQGNVWASRRAKFYETFGNSEVPHPVYGMPTAFDFLFVLSDISARKANLEHAAVAA